MKGIRWVAIVEDYWDIISQIHSKDCLHAGIRKTFARIQSIYSHIPRSVVNQYLKLCATCNLRKPQATQAPLKPILASGVFSRVQVSMTHDSYYSHQFILIKFAPSD